MCIGCPDFVTYCNEGECCNPNDGPYGLYNKFYLGDEYCKHLKLKLKKDIAESGDNIENW